MGHIKLYIILDGSWPHKLRCPTASGLKTKITSLTCASGFAFFEHSSSDSDVWIWFLRGSNMASSDQDLPVSGSEVRFEVDSLNSSEFASPPLLQKKRPGSVHNLVPGLFISHSVQIRPLWTWMAGVQLAAWPFGNGCVLTSHLVLELRCPTLLPLWRPFMMRPYSLSRRVFHFPFHYVDMSRPEPKQTVKLPPCKDGYHLLYGIQFVADWQAIQNSKQTFLEARIRTTSGPRWLCLGASAWITRQRWKGKNWERQVTCIRIFYLFLLVSAWNAIY